MYRYTSIATFHACNKSNLTWMEGLVSLFRIKIPSSNICPKAIHQKSPGNFNIPRLQVVENLKGKLVFHRCDAKKRKCKDKNWNVLLFVRCTF